jgi:hypothetical protein
MRKFCLRSVVAFGVLFACVSLVHAQQAGSNANAQQNNNVPRANPYLGMPVDGWTNQPVKPANAGHNVPAPRHDISGIWDPGNGGIQAVGPSAMPEDGKPEHELPYTPEGLAALRLTKPSNGVRSVLPGDTNDPVVACNPQGFPREDLYELRTTQILQTRYSMYILYEFGKIWRVIWTDGREFPRDAAPRWFGYSIGKWVDDYTFVVETTGINDEVWVDRDGRPHSPELRVEERFHRVDHDTLELTVTIIDPKMYTKPWIAMNKLPFKLQSPHFDVTEMMCSPAELAKYNEFIGEPASEKETK